IFRPSYNAYLYQLVTCSIISWRGQMAKLPKLDDRPLSQEDCLGMDDVATRIWPLPARKIIGIGPKATEKLTRLGINTIGELAAMPTAFLVAKFGASTGAWLHRVANGLDERPVITESEPKSISRETTFEHDLHAQQDRTALTDAFTWLCMRVADDLKGKGYVTRTVGIKLRYADFHAVTRDVTLPAGVSDGVLIRKAAGECLKRVPLDQKIRLLGIRASGLIPLAEVETGTTRIQAELPF
ncbi:MAG: DNA polymerase IV, partial [Candidatus Dechloromonas phosphoritropha]|nr:DNA polymerase IV [Azonexus sp.]